MERKLVMNVDDLPINESVNSSLKPLMPMYRRKYWTKYTRFPGSRKFYPTHGAWKKHGTGLTVLVGTGHESV